MQATNRETRNQGAPITSTRDRSRVVWIGRLEVAPQPGCDSLKRAAGAFVNAVVPARDGHEFESRVKEALMELGFALLVVEESGPFRWLAGHDMVTSELVTLAREAEASGQVRFASFHSYKARDEESAQS